MTTLCFKPHCGVSPKNIYILIVQKRVFLLTVLLKRMNLAVFWLAVGSQSAFCRDAPKTNDYQECNYHDPRD